LKSRAAVSARPTVDIKLEVDSIKERGCHMHDGINA
jgi:hypothetical protein